MVIGVLSFFLLMVHAREKKETLLDGIVIVLDAGHGGKDQGVNCVEGSEAQINLAIVKKMEQKLAKYGASVVLTRDGDYDLASKNAVNRKKEDLKARMELIEKHGADLFISIHANSFGSSQVRGMQLFYQEDSKASEQLCEMVHRHLEEAKIDLLKDKVGDYYVLKNSKVPSLLVECGFLSNAEDRDLLFQEYYQNLLADKMSKAVLQYFSFIY